MIEIFQKATPTNREYTIDDIVVLDHIQRSKGRLKITSQKGVEVRIFLERGNILQANEVLQSACHKFVSVSLAKEPVVTARTDSWEDFSRACYHLGNRHTRIQIGERWLRFVEDPVLVELVEHLGLRTKFEDAEFDPESGAYGHGHAGKAKHHHHDEHQHSDHAH